MFSSKIYIDIYGIFCEALLCHRSRLQHLVKNVTLWNSVSYEAKRRYQLTNSQSAYVPLSMMMGRHLSASSWKNFLNRAGSSNSLAAG